MPTMYGSFITRSLLAASLLATALVASAQDTARPAAPQTSAGASAGGRGQQTLSPCAMAMMGRSGLNPMYRPGGMGGSDGFGMASDLAPLGMLALNADQRAGISKIQDELCMKKLDLSDQIASNQAELRALYAADSRDVRAIDRQYEKLFALQRKAIETDVDAADRIEALLSAEQRNTLKKFRMGPPGMNPPAGKLQGANGR